MKNINKKRLLTTFLCSFSVLFSLFAQNKDYVLLLNSIHVEGTWTEYFNLELDKAFKQDGHLELKTYTLSVPLLGEEEEAVRMQQDILTTYPTPPLAVIIVGDPAWLVCTPLFDKQWKDIPIILCYSRSRIPSSLRVLLDKSPLTKENSLSIDELNKKYNITVLENPSYLEGTVDLMRKLQPQMQKLAFISDNRYISVYTCTELIELMERRFPDMKLEILTEQELDVKQLLDKLDSYGPEVGILFYSWIKSEQEYENYYWANHFNRCLSAVAHIL